MASLMHSTLSVFPASLKSGVKERLGLYGRLSYAQYGEDLAAEPYLRDVTDGFYVDIGAYHPVRFSNTYFYFRRGWRGINVDPLPAAIARFEQWRPRDANVAVGIGMKEGVERLFVFDEPALNTFDAEVARGIVARGHYRLIEEIDVPIMRLETLLDRYAAQRSIDLMSIDVEGHEMQVLASNDWSRFSPRVMLLELNDADCERALGAEASQFLVGNGYRLVAKTFNTLVFIRE